MTYIEPAPIKDKENPLESMMQRFDIAVRLLGISDEMYHIINLIKCILHDPVHSPVHPFEVPFITHPVLHPFKIRDGNPSGIGQDVRHYHDSFFMNNVVRPGGGGSVCSLHN